MALPTWPNGLPYASERDAYQVRQLGSPVVKSPMQSGRTRQRRQFTLSVATVQWSCKLTPAELTTFRNFVKVTLGDGTARFTMPVWDASTQTFPSKTVMIEDGVGGIAEADLLIDTMVSMTLKVEGL